MEKLSLKTIAEVIGAQCDKDALISDICTDTRKISKGCLFIAIKGERFDAHDFVDDAIKKGAVAAVCSKPVKTDGTVLMCKDTREAYLDIAGYYRSLFDIPVVGLTGSVGKTTTKEFAACAMSAKYKTLKTEGNLNNEVGMPATLLRLDKSCEAAIIEMGMNHFGEIHNLTLRSRPTTGIITNIGVAHIEALGSRDGILKAKLEILDGMEKDAPLILNGDDDKLSALSLPDRKVYYFGINNKKSFFTATDIYEKDGKLEFNINCEGKAYKTVLSVMGIHNVYNALAGFAVAYLNGAQPEKICSALGKYKPVGMRQRVADCGSFKVIEDCYNASPDSMKASLKMLSDMRGSKKIAVLGDMKELGDFSEQMHTEVGYIAAEQGVDLLLGYGEQAKNYCKGAAERGVKAVCFTNSDELLDRILKETDEGTVILFKASHAMHLEKIIESLYERKGINE